MANDPAIHVRGLVKRYGRVTAVDGVDLEVAPGETLALLGPNGAGKTTTIECCEGYRAPDEGEVRVLGLDPRRDAARLMPRIGVMLQEGGIYPMARPPEVLALFAAFYADPIDPVALLSRVGLDGAARTRFRDLSGGQKQRLSLALAVIGRPDLVFLDEPTAGLDVAARRATWAHIEELRADGVTIVLSTHLLDEAEHLADRVVILDRGTVVAHGTPAELTHGHDAAAGVEFSAVSGLDLEALRGAVGAPVQEIRAGVYRIEATNEPAMVARLARWLEEHDVRLGELRAGKRSLEEVFLRLTTEAAASPGAVTAPGVPVAAEDGA